MVFSGGEEFAAFTVFAKDASGNRTQSDGITQTNQNSEWQLSKNESYVIEVNNIDADNTADLNFQLTWIELES